MKNPKERALMDDLELWGFQDETMIFDDGSLGFAFKLSPIDISCFADQSLIDLKSKVMQLLSSLPPGTDLQFVYEIRHQSKKILTDHEALVSPTAGDAPHRLTRVRIEELKSDIDQARIATNKLHLFVRRPPSRPLIERKLLPILLAGKKRYEALAEDQLALDLGAVTQLKAVLSAELAQIGLSPRELSPREILSKVYEQWNPDRKDTPEKFEFEDLKPSLLYSDVGVLDRGFLIGETEHRVISLKAYPDQLMPGMADVISELPLGARLFLTVHVPDQQKEIESLKTQRRIAYAMVRGKRTGVSDLDSEAKLQDLESLLEQMISEGERVFRASINVVLRAKEGEAKLIQDTEEVHRILRSIGGAEAMEETLASYFVFRELAIPNARATERSRRLKSSYLADLIPIFGPFSGMATPRVLLRNLHGGLVGVDPFDPALTNANQLISGGSGAGKSFLVNVFMMHLLKENPQIFFVEIGASYKKICENLGGTYLHLDPGTGISINPFDLAPGEVEPSSQKLKFLLGLIELMTKEEGDAGLSRLTRSELEAAIQELYGENQSPRLSDLRNKLLISESDDLKRIGKILRLWCGDSPYGRLIDRPTSVDLKSRLIAFDLKGMESYPDLQAVCLFLITDLVWREIIRDRSTMKFLVFDECWKILKSDAGLVFIEEVFRTFRKYRASAIAISQDIDDFAKSKISGAILPNCSIKWILMQPQADGKRLAEVLNLNEKEIALIKSLKQEKGVYSEAFLMAQSQHAVVATGSTPLEYWLATTEPRDLAAIDELSRSRPELSLIEQISLLSEKYPRGLVALQNVEVKS